MSAVVERAGLLTTVQDLGRRMQRYGVSGGGAMDRSAARVANLLVGNDEGAAVLEATVLGPALRFADERVVAVTGGDFPVTVDDVPVGTWRAARVPAGAVLDVHAARHGCRAYIAVSGGIAVPAVLGSRATDLVAQFGGVDGRALHEGDVVTFLDGGEYARRLLRRLRDGGAPATPWSAARSLRTAARSRVRVLPGPEWDWFADAAQTVLLDAAFTVSAQSNRMGYRLDGAVLERSGDAELLSSPVTMGTIQVPAGGQPIVLMADRQSTGGYPRIAHVITADLPVLAQIPPGGAVRFELVGHETAVHALLGHERDLRMFAAALELQ